MNPVAAHKLATCSPEDEAVEEQTGKKLCEAIHQPGRATPAEIHQPGLLPGSALLLHTPTRPGHMPEAL